MLNPLPIIIWGTFIAAAAIVSPWFLIGAAAIIVFSVVTSTRS